MTNKWEADTIGQEPAIEKEHGRAWRVNLDSPGHTAVACWVVEAPWAHPIWHSYVISLVHLRETPGIAAPVLYLTGATHELVVAALDPDWRREPAVLEGKFRMLQPANFSAQMISESDDKARMEVAHAVDMICEGTLSPDTDFRQHWISLFGDNMIRAADRRLFH